MATATDTACHPLASAACARHACDLARLGRDEAVRAEWKRSGVMPDGLHALSMPVVAAFLDVVDAGLIRVAS